MGSHVCIVPPLLLLAAVVNILWSSSSLFSTPLVAAMKPPEGLTLLKEVNVPAPSSLAPRAAVGGVGDDASSLADASAQERWLAGEACVRKFSEQIDQMYSASGTFGSSAEVRVLALLKDFFHPCMKAAGMGGISLVFPLRQAEADTSLALGPVLTKFALRQFNATTPAQLSKYIQLTPLRDSADVFKHISDNIKEGNYLKVETGFMYRGLQLAEYANADALADLSVYLKQSSETSTWFDILPYARLQTAVYGGKVVGVPMEGRYTLMMVRRDVFAAAGLPYPVTWEEVVEAAARLNGTDMNGDGVPDWGICSPFLGAALGGPDLVQMQPPPPSSTDDSTAPPGASSSHGGCQYARTMLLSILAPYLQVNGSSSGTYIDAESMNILMNTDGAKAAVEVMDQMMPLMHPASLNRCLSYMPEMTRGECAIGFGRIIQYKAAALANYSRVKGELEVLQLPGSTRVWNRRTKRLEACSNTSCPWGKAMQLMNGSWANVNFAPFLPASSFGCAVTSIAPEALHRSTYHFCSQLGESNESLQAVMDPTVNYGPSRYSQLDIDKWAQYGYDRDDVKRVLDLVQELMEHYQNVAADLPLLPETVNYLLPHMSSLLSKYYLGGMTGHQMLEAIDKQWKKWFTQWGKQRVARMYRLSINWNPPEGYIDDVGEGNAKAAHALLLRVAVAVPIAVLVLSALALLFVLSHYGKSRQMFGRKQPPMAGSSTTLLVTDIEDSTGMWESMPLEIMDATLKIHHDTLRSLLSAHRGYESTTEGDSFILAFHEAGDALSYAIQAQYQLLLAPWPVEILEHPLCRPVYMQLQHGDPFQRVWMEEHQASSHLFTLRHGPIAAWMAYPSEKINALLGYSSPTSVIPMKNWTEAVKPLAKAHKPLTNAAGPVSQSVKPLQLAVIPARNAVGKQITEAVQPLTKMAKLLTRPAGDCMAVKAQWLPWQTRGRMRKREGHWRNQSEDAGVTPEVEANGGADRCLGEARGSGGRGSSSARLPYGAAAGVVPAQDEAYFSSGENHTISSEEAFFTPFNENYDQCSLETDPSDIAASEETSLPTSEESNVSALEYTNIFPAANCYQSSGQHDYLAADGRQSSRQYTIQADRPVSVSVVFAQDPWINPGADAVAGPRLPRTAQAANADVATAWAAAADLAPTQAANADLVPGQAAGAEVGTGQAAACTMAVAQTAGAEVATAADTAMGAARMVATCGTFLEACRQAWAVMGESEARDTTAVLTFRGPRIRMGLSSGVEEASVTINRLDDHRVHYKGTPLVVAKLVADAGHGGCILLSESTYQQLDLSRLWREVLFLNMGRNMLTRSGPTMTVYKVMPRPLRCRTAVISQLRGSCQQVDLGIMDAPVGCVNLVMMRVVGLDTLMSWNKRITSIALDTLQQIVHEELLDQGGYQIDSSNPDMVQAAFTCPTNALTWGTTCIQRLKAAAWPPELLGHVLGEKVELVREGAKLLLLKGLRVKVGAGTGHIVTGVNPITGKLSYRGPLMYLVSCICAQAASNELLCTRTMWKAALKLESHMGNINSESSLTAHHTSAKAPGSARTSEEAAQQESTSGQWLQPPDSMRETDSAAQDALQQPLHPTQAANLCTSRRDAPSNATSGSDRNHAQSTNMHLATNSKSSTDAVGMGRNHAQSTNTCLATNSKSNADDGVSDRNHVQSTNSNSKADAGVSGSKHIEPTNGKSNADTCISDSKLVQSTNSQPASIRSNAEGGATDPSVAQSRPKEVIAADLLAATGRSRISRQLSMLLPSCGLQANPAAPLKVPSSMLAGNVEDVELFLVSSMCPMYVGRHRSAQLSEQHAGSFSLNDRGRAGTSSGGHASTSGGGSGDGSGCGASTSSCRSGGSAITGGAAANTSGGSSSGAGTGSDTPGGGAICGGDGGGGGASTSGVQEQRKGYRQLL